MADPRVSESVQRAAFGGTPTAAYDARQGKTENAVWNAITKAWEFGTKPLYGSGDEGDIGRAVGDAQKIYRDINPSFEQAPTGQRDPYGLERYQQVRDDEARADRFSDYQGTAAKGVGSSVVAAMEAAEFAWSHAVSRPISTYNLLLADKFDEDADRKITVGDAWNRSATVSAGMAITDTSVEVLSGLQNMFLNLGASGDNFVDLSDWDVDTWDEKSINEAYQRGEAYSIVTGTIDTAVNLLPIPAGKGTGAIARKAGLSRNAGVRPNLTGEYDRAIDGMIAEGVDPNGRYVGSVYLEGDVLDEATEATVRAADDEVDTVPSRVAEKADPAPEPERLPSGAPVSVSGKNAVSKEIIELTETDDIARIIESPLIREQVGADPTVLASVISETDSYKEVLRIYMALRGDTVAAAKLFETNKAAAAQISGVFDVLNKAEPGAMVQLTEDTHEALLKSMTPAESRLYKALVIDGGFSSQGYRTLRTGMAGSSPLARATQSVARGLEKGVGARADLRAAAKSQDFKRITQSRVGTRTKTAPDGTVYQEAIVGSRYGLLTKIIDFNPKLGKSLKKKATNTFGRVPLNVFSYARTRPTDAIDEFYAMVGDSPVLTSGGMVKIGDFADEITAQEWIAGASKRLADAQGTSVGKLKETFSEIEREMAIMIGISKGLSEAKTLEILNGFKYKAEQLMGEVQKRQGFYDTGSGMQISFDKETISMLADSEMLVPLDDFAKHLELDDAVNGIMGRGFVRTSQGAKTAFDLGQSFFRTGMLLKPGYIMRNAFFEPGVTAAIAHMGTVPHKMVGNAAQGTLNFGLNLFDRINGRVMKTLSPNSRRKLVAAENRYIAAMNARDKILLDLDEIEEGARKPSDLPKKRQLDAAKQRAIELTMVALRTIAEIDENVAADIASTVDYDFATRIIRGSRSILRGNDKKLDRVAKEINDLENSGVLDLELGELDLAYIDKLYMEYEVLLAVREAREGLRTPGQRGAKDTGKPMLPGKDKDNLEPVVFRDTGDTGTSTMVYQNVQKLLKTYARRSADILYDDSYNDALGEITRATEELVEAASVYRGERAKYISKTARREKRQARRRRIGEKTKEITLSNGQKVLYREAFSGTKGDAYRVDASGRVTAIQSFAPMGGESAVASLNRLRMNLVETKPIGPTHPQYFEDLHYFATRHVAGDKRIAAALGPKAYDSQGRDVRVKKVYDAVKKDKAFRDEMGIKNLDDAQRYAEEIVDIIETYYPTQAARDLIASNGKYGPGELAEAITSDPNVVLRPIDGHVVKKLDSTPGERVRRTTQKFFETLWNAIAVTPEATLGRWPFYARQHEIAFKRNMETMLAQSPTGKVSIKQQDAAQLAAHREALRELEKTFYTIRRYNRSIFTSRYLQSFPGAWANGLWRYMYYIPKNKPAETLTALLVGKNVLDSVLKDSNGEPTDYWDEDARIVIPLSKGLKMVGVDYDYDWEVSKEGYTRIFADVPPSRSYLSAVTIDSFMQYAPSFMRKRLPDWTIGDKSMDDRADDMQAFVDDMGEYYYEQTGDKTLFEEIIRPALFSEYGPTRKFLLDGVPGTALGSVTPGWARSLVALGAAKMNKEFTDDYNRIANYRIQVVSAEKEANGDDTPIDFAKEVAPQVGAWFLLRFVEQFTNLAAGSVPMPRYPGGLEREEWRKISDENPGMDYEDRVMLLEKKFPDTPVEQLLPFTKSTTQNVYDVPRTVGAFNYVERHSDVAQRIVDEMGDPAMVGLMVMDENYGPSGFSDTVYRAMRDKPPYEGGDNYIINIPPDDYAVAMDVSRGWNEFEKIDAAFQVEIQRAREAGDRDAVKQLKYDRRRWLEGPNEEPESMRMKFPSWHSRYGPSKDRAKLTANTIERYIIGDKKIWNDKKEDPAWLLLQQFLIDRRAALDLKASVTDNEQKARVDEWMYSNYEPLMEQYPMTEDLWNNTFEVEFYEEPEAQ